MSSGTTPSAMRASGATFFNCTRRSKARSTAGSFLSDLFVESRCRRTGRVSFAGGRLGEDEGGVGQGPQDHAEHQSASCHVPPLYTEPGNNLHSPSEIGIDSFQADRSPTHAYLAFPLTARTPPRSHIEDPVPGPSSSLWTASQRERPTQV